MPLIYRILRILGTVHNYQLILNEFKILLITSISTMF